MHDIVKYTSSAEHQVDSIEWVAVDICILIFFISNVFCTRIKNALYTVYVLQTVKYQCQ